jgi:hypothetical protein
MRLAQNIARVAARKVSLSTNNTSSAACQIPNRKESTAVKDIRDAIKHPSACSGVTLSDRVAIDGASNIVSCFVGAPFLGSMKTDILRPSNEDQDQQSAEAEQPIKESQKPPTAGDDISLRWDASTGEDTQRNDTPLSPKLPQENFYDYCFETPSNTAMMRSPLSPPPPPRPDRAMIQCIRPPIPKQLLVPVF